MAKPRILFIDAYDSFSNNIIALVHAHLDVEVTVIRIDSKLDKASGSFACYIQQFSAIILGPGPGHPMNATDVGLFNKVWDLSGEHVIPVLGICLGFQSMVHAFGGTIERLAVPQHGLVRQVRPCISSETVEDYGNDLFHGVEPGRCMEVVQYHSLHALLPPPAPAGLAEASKGTIIGLAWQIAEDNVSTAGNEFFLANPDRILMAAKHSEKPFSGVQFHPESICSSHNAAQVLDNWWVLVKKWWAAQGFPSGTLNRQNGSTTLLKSIITNGTLSLDHAKCSYITQTNGNSEQVSSKASAEKVNRSYNTQANGISEQVSAEKVNRSYNTQTNGSSEQVSYKASAEKGNRSYNTQTNGISEQISAEMIDSHSGQVHTIVVPLGNWTLSTVCESLKLIDKDIIILDSENHQRTVVGENTIIACVSDDLPRLDYFAGSGVVSVYQSRKVTRVVLKEVHEGDVFQYLKSFMNTHKYYGGVASSTFWGGLVGHIGYEACLERIGLVPNESGQVSATAIPPDMTFAYVERSIVFSHTHQHIYIQSLSDSDEAWMRGVEKVLSAQQCVSAPVQIASQVTTTEIKLPEKGRYQNAIRRAQEHIRAGDSYELCLTTKGEISCRSSATPWEMYCRLRQLNPAPFGAFLSLGPLSVLSSSPERFLCWTRPTCKDGDIKCQLRPIKGTIARQPSDPSLPLRTLEDAELALASPKERAENLMILDLIRHDLHGAVGSLNVSVPQLMVVEEYKTIFQLVSVIEGNLAGHVSDVSRVKEEATETKSTTASCGLDILACSLPPGSMTGAPKLRSCQLLQGLEEQRPRGLYSGVIGYIDVGGGGDFSVVIRTAIRNQDRGKGDEQTQKWTIGAGGAITALSDEAAEYDEMMTKMSSALRLFE